MPLVRYPVIDGNHVPISQSHNDGFSADSQEIAVPMDKGRPEGTEYQPVTSTSGEALETNFRVVRSKHTIKYPQRYDPGIGDAR